MDTYNAYTHTYAHVYKHSNVYAFLRSLHAFIYSYIHIQYTQTCIYMHKYKRMRIHTHRHKISVPFCFLHMTYPYILTYTTSHKFSWKSFVSNYNTVIFLFIFLCFCTNKSNAKVYTLIIHGKKYTAHKAPNFRSDEKITKCENTNVLF